MKTIICKDIYNKEYEVPVEELTIRVAVYALIIKDNKILLTHQWDGYSLAGGGIKKGETAEEAIIREVYEETGLRIIPDKVVYQSTSFFKRTFKDFSANQSIQLYFACNKFSGTLNNNQITKSEVNYTYDIPEWVKLDKLDNITFRHSVDLQILLKAYNEFYPKGK